MALLMIGCGRMGGALLGGWLRDGITKSLETVAIVDPRLGRAPDGATLFPTLDALGQRCFDIIVVAIKPQQVDSVLPPYRHALARGGFFLSIAAGVSVKRLAALTGGPVLRAMPTLSAVIGKGITALCRQGATLQQLETASTLFAANGTVLRLDTEADIDRFTAVAGSGPGYMFEIMRCYLLAAREIGFDAETARQLVVQTVIGSAEMAARSALGLAALRDQVTSKAGTTAAGLARLQADGDLEDRFRRTLQAAFERAQTLAKE